jgi:Flp pilus assembly protein TadG
VGIKAHQRQLSGVLRRDGRDRGALILSYVIVFPVFLLAILVVVQGAVWSLARQEVIAAARQGVDAARAQNAPLSAGPAEAVSFARASGSGFLRDPSATAAGSTASTIQITVTGRVVSLIPGLPVSVSETVQAPRERFYQ